MPHINGGVGSAKYSAATPYITEGLAALSANDLAQSRLSLTEAIRRDPNNVASWLGMAAAIEEPLKVRFCLEHILCEQPAHLLARALLASQPAAPTADGWPGLPDAETPISRFQNSAEASADGQAASETVRKGNSRPTVLIVDDSATVRMLVQSILQRHGYEVITASDGLQACAQIAHHTFDLILLDITLPLINGHELCRLMKDYPPTHDVPVVMLTARQSLFDRAKGRKFGASQYMTKPFESGKLLATVQRLLAGQPMQVG